MGVILGLLLRQLEGGLVLGSLVGIAVGFANEKRDGPGWMRWKTICGWTVIGAAMGLGATGFTLYAGFGLVLGAIAGCVVGSMRAARG